MPTKNYRKTRSIVPTCVLSNGFQCDKGFLEARVSDALVQIFWNRDIYWAAQKILPSKSIQDPVLVLFSDADQMKTGFTESAQNGRAETHLPWEEFQKHIKVREHCLHPTAVWFDGDAMWHEHFSAKYLRVPVRPSNNGRWQGVFGWGPHNRK